MPRITVLLIALTIAGGCPPAAKPPAGPPAVKGKGGEVNEKPRGPRAREVKTLKLPKSMIIGENVTLSGFYEDDAGDPGGKAVEERAREHVRGDEINVYRKIAPATVIISTAGGYGSGVLYHKDGWILTNHHVIARAKRENFRMRVTVNLGQLNAKGVMERLPQSYTAVVHKQDPLRDLAVIKLDNPPPGLVTVGIAAEDPPPGQRVWALGHAGIGLVWAIKGGQIAAVGKLSTHLAQLLLLDTQRQEAASKGPLAGSLAKLRTRRLEKMKKEMARQRPALVIQSTCDISQGDSGGPLVNAEGDLVGLNAFIRGSYGTRKESNFHIHVEEVRKFIQEVPQDPPQLVPDPWTEGGTMARLGDADMDAKVDVLAMYRMKKRRLFGRSRATCYLLDLDQNSFSGAAALPEVRKVMADRSMDVEMIFLEVAGHIYAWFDRDNDGSRDILLVAPANRVSKVKGYRIDPKGLIKRDEALDGKYLIRPALFTDPALGKRLLAMGQQIFNRSLMSGHLAGSVPPPDPIKGAGHQGKLRDLSGDGKPETVASEGLFSSGYILDLDQDSLGKFPLAASPKEVMEQGKVDAELSWIIRGRERWVWYDRDNDGRFDLLLQASKAPLDFADKAWSISPGGERSPAPGFVGRKLVRAELFKEAKLGAALNQVAAKIMPSRAVAKVGPLETFPETARYHTWGIRIMGAAKWKEVAINVRYSRCKGLLVDVDRDTPRKARKAGRSVKAQVRSRQFDAEFIRLRCGSKEWAFYDTRGTGRFDLVLYSPNYLRSTVEAAYVIHKKGGVTRRKKPIKCKGVVHPALFRKAGLRRAFKRMAAELIKPAPDFSCKP